MNHNESSEASGGDQDPPLPPKPLSTEDDAGPLSSTLHRLSLATASETPLPASSPARPPSPRKTPKKLRDVASSANPNDRTATQSPIRRTPSSLSLRTDRRSSTPLLTKRTSMSSLQNVGGVTPPRSDLSRRSSSQMLRSPSANMFPKSPLAQQAPAHTPASVAQEHFEKEIDLHTSTQAKTIVIVHDQCYGHRFSRPRTSKASLSTIVERPERILASVLGLAAAYVRLGGRHHGGRYPPHPDLDLQLLQTPPFRICKTTRTMALNSPAVTGVHGNKWMEELKTMCETAESKLALNGKELVRQPANGKEEDGSPKRKFHEGDLYLCSESLNALEGALGGVCDGIDAVFGPNPTRRAFVAIRPPGHHCAADYPSGFCWLNNVHVGIVHAAMTHGLTHAAIIDFDLHHGDGSQAITWDHNRRATTLPKNAASFKKTPIGYFSLHDINSYPCEMGDEEKIRSASLCIENAHGQSIWNVHLQPWKNSRDFWDLYETKYMVLLEKARNFLRLHTERLSETPNNSPPKAAIFLSAGFDASEWEGAGMQRHKVNVPTDFYAKFTSDVVKMSEEEGLGVDGRIISVLEGGYSDRALTSGVLSHVCGLASVGAESYQASELTSARLASEMRSRLGLSDVHENGINAESEEVFGSFDTDWWAPSQLEALELLVNPPPPPPAPKKPKDKLPPTYSSPTQSSTAKRVPSFSFRRSVSGTPSLEHHDSVEPPPVPIPDVDWAVAAHELSKVLIPSHRQTRSCKHEELNAEATRARRERYSTVGLPAAPAPAAEDGKRMQLRDRKAKGPSYVLDERDPRPTSRSSRRQTIAAVEDLPDPGATSATADGAADFNRLAITHRRRSSVASSVASSISGMDGGSAATSGQSTRQPSLEISKSRNGFTSATNNVATTVQPSSVAAVKKIRNVSGPRPKATTGRTSPRKAPPVPRVPSTYRAIAPTTTSQEPESTNIRDSEGASGSVPLEERANADDLDALTSNMKKMTIKLNMPPKEEQVVKEKAGVEEKKKMVGRAPKKATAPKTSKPATAKSTNKNVTNTSVAGPVIIQFNTEQALTPELNPPVLPSNAPPLSQELDALPDAAPANAMRTPPLSAEDSEQPHANSNHTAPAPAVEIHNNHRMTNVSPLRQSHPPSRPLSYQADGPTSPPRQSKPLAHANSPTRHPLPHPARLSMSSRTYSPPTHKTNLPNFTSTSPIPFGKSSPPNNLPGILHTYSPQNSGSKPRSGSGSGSRPGSSGSPTIAPGTYRQPEKPFVPYRPVPFMNVAGSMGNGTQVSGDSMDIDPEMRERQAERIGSITKDVETQSGDGSIWDVPDTPMR